MHITLDGLHDVHNKRRLEKSGKDSFIDLCHISKNHIHEFLELYYERHIENRN